VNLPQERPVFRFILALAILALLTVTGTVGYRLVEHVAWFDALYMTVITLSTVGFGEVIPLSRQGRMFTMGLILSGVGTAAYLFTSMAQLLAVDVLTKLVLGNPMQKLIDKLTGHVIVCGHGRLGQILVEELARHNVPLVIIERDPAKESELKQSAHPYLIGNATSDETLARAGIERARAIVAGTNSDPDNVFITLAAREKSAKLQIHARGETGDSIRRMKQAGADYVISAYQMGGLSLAASIIRPAVSQFLEIARPRKGHEVDMEEIRVLPGAPMVGRTLVEIEHAARKVRIVALLRDERIELVPDEQTRIAAGDNLVVIGERRGLEQLALQAAP
jgi:voltage-gated potassium channel